MEYIVFDLEFNQGFDKELNKTVSDERCPFEIIQIGAIKLDSQFNIIDTFNSYIKPEVYRDIHPFIKKMTSITLKDVKNAPTFPVVYKDFKKFISSKNSVLCVWGTGDLKELYRNITYHGLPSKTLPKNYINIQKHASDYLDNPSGKSIGLQNAISILGLEEEKSYHDALNDAYYTAKVFIKIYNPNIVPCVYVYSTLKSSAKRSSKKDIDYNGLFNEFKKILGRDLTDEDKNVIEIAYKLGKSNKFSINSTSSKKK